MTDTLDELLADLRDSAVHEIRPPGAAAARRTVRRRRAATVVASACAAVLAITGGVALTRHPVDQGKPVVASSSDPAGLSKVAQRKLRETDDAIAAIDVAAPVSTDYGADQKTQYLGNLTLRLACAGEGQITLVIQGRRNPITPWAETARVTASCAVDPVPAETLFAMAGPIGEYRFRLIDSERADGQAGFAYRVTSDTGEPVDASKWMNSAIDPFSAIKVNGRKSLNGGTMRFGVTEPVMVEGPGLREARYRLAVACAGWGTALVEVHLRGKIVASTSFECEWPAGQKEIEVGRIDEAATLHLGYRSEKPADSLIASTWFRE
ncbi:hypothetical protein ACQP2E_02595 [Actinoplanes sp. CA-015351]|uniref:hypothetical protein n=1 Tax=Actinoplanes sp. CA-015351 TaxID=3239897 RepID=UPI003D969707